MKVWLQSPDHADSIGRHHKPVRNMIAIIWSKRKSSNNRPWKQLRGSYNSSMNNKHASTKKNKQQRGGSNNTTAVEQAGKTTTTTYNMMRYEHDSKSECGRPAFPLNQELQVHTTDGRHI